MTLPEAFTERMRTVLGGGFDGFIAMYDLPHLRGVRVNTLKFPLSRAAGLDVCGKPVPFSPLGFYAAGGADSVGHHPFHHAGAFYSQEPSAMAAVTALDPRPGEYILDMCAAPGGKSTQIAALMRGEGLLYCNEYVRSRAGVLLSNIERLGVASAVVTSLHPDKYAEAMPRMFDRVLVDAPCSGEGMFRRDERAIAEWSPEHVVSCAARQSAILDSAAECVREGGVLVYSTCTFSPEENELNIAAFLDRHVDFSLEPVQAGFGRAGLDLSDAHDLALCRRIYPADGGEGHFVARMRRLGESSPRRASGGGFDGGSAPSAAIDTLGDILRSMPSGTLFAAGDNVYLLPAGYGDMPALPVIRAGVLAAELKKGRAEPAHALFMSAAPDNISRVIDLPADSAELRGFLRGEETGCPEDMRGYAAVCCGGVVTGFGKCSGGRLKNRYPKGLRETR